MSKFASSYGYDLLNGEPLIDEIIEAEDFAQIIYDSGLFDDNPYVIDYGGGIKGITCRAVIEETEGKHTQLAKMLGLKGHERTQAQIFMQLCAKKIHNASSYNYG
jgi:hypothetical protein